MSCASELIDKKKNSCTCKDTTTPKLIQVAYGRGSKYCLLNSVKLAMTLDRNRRSKDLGQSRKLT